MVKWEIIEETLIRRTDRLKVRGGWLVRTIISSSVHMVFIEDTLHYWKLDE